MFIIFIILMIISSLCIILSKNIIQSLLYLVFIFIQSSILFIFLGADFIGLIILIVYIGAIAVLFLFVIMMLNVRLLEIYSTFLIYLPLSVILSLLLIFLCIYIFIFNFNLLYFDNLLIYTDWIQINNIKIISIGQLLFNDLYLYFFGASLLLFVAMVGAILLTLEYKIIKVIKYKKMEGLNINWKFLT